MLTSYSNSPSIYVLFARSGLMSPGPSPWSACCQRNSMGILTLGEKLLCTWQIWFQATCTIFGKAFPGFWLPWAIRQHQLLIHTLHLQILQHVIISEKEQRAWRIPLQDHVPLLNGALRRHHQCSRHGLRFLRHRLPPLCLRVLSFLHFVLFHLGYPRCHLLILFYLSCLSQQQVYLGGQHRQGHSLQTR